MKQILILIAFLNFANLDVFGQELRLTDLMRLCNKENWEDINQSLLAKKWEYYDSQKGDTYKYNTIAWSYDKDYYSDAAAAWFFLYTYEGYPNKIVYSVFNKESYLRIQRSISSAGFKLSESEIENNEIISTYKNANYILKISTEKRENNDNSWDNSSITAYSITLIKKEGIYDPNNGYKKEYYSGGALLAEYTLLEGEFNGRLTFYHENGQLKKTGFFKRGVENGIFKEYDSSGNIEIEYKMANGQLNGYFKRYYENGRVQKTGNFQNGEEHGTFIDYDENGTKVNEYVMTNGLKNGVFKTFNDGKISVSATFKNDVRHGQQIEYYYNNSTGQLQLMYLGDFLNDQKDGNWKYIFIGKDKSKTLLSYETYVKGIKHGAFQEASGDSLILGSFKNGKLHGKYKVFIDAQKLLLGGLIRTDTTQLTLLTDGAYNEGLKEGYWKMYDFTGTLRSEGKYLNDKETGEWRYYYTSWSNGKESLPYSKQLYLVQNYKNGKLNGISTRYSYLEKEEFPCSELANVNHPFDTCERYNYSRVLETLFYNNGVLNGPAEFQDSTNEIIAKGNFTNGLKEGEWLHRYTQEPMNGEPYFIFQRGNYIQDKREGSWIQYLSGQKNLETFNYENGKLHGDYIVRNNFNRPAELRKFSHGKLTEITVYDSLGFRPTKKYEIYNETSNSFKCRKTEYSDDYYMSQEYWLKKDGDINPIFFRFIFELYAGESSDGTMGYKDGYIRLFKSNDKPVMIGKYFKEKRIGLWTYYDYEQGVKFEYRFEEDKLMSEKYFTLDGELFNGEYIATKKDENVREVRKIKNGLRNGKTTVEDLTTGKVIKKETYKNGEKKS